MTKTNTYPKLKKDITVDVCIIGGGLTGVVTAYLLAKAGKKVAILEEKTIGSGATSKTTAFLTQAVDTDFQDLVKMLGEDGARLVLHSHGDAINLVETTVLEENIDCDFKRASNYIFASDEKELEGLKKEHDVLTKLGAEVDMVPGSVLQFPNAGALEFRDQAKYYASKYLASLARIASDIGVQIYEGTSAKKIDTEAFTVQAGRNTVHADWIISATYHPFNEPAGLFLKKAMYRTYVFRLNVPKGALREAMYEDQKNPYHYFRVDSGEKNDTIIVGGEDHREDVPVSDSKNYEALEDLAKKTFTFPFSIESRWSGPILEPIDGLAYIGPYGHPRVLYAFGFSGSGMTYAHIAAMMFRDTVMSIKSPWQNLYDPARIPGPTALYVKGKDYTEELLDGAVKNAFTYRKKK